MLNVDIIDVRVPRRKEMRAWLLGLKDVSVRAESSRSELPVTSQRPDVLLLHVGVAQAALDNLHEIIMDVASSCWIIGYRGGLIAEGVKECRHPHYSLFRHEIAADICDPDFKDTIARVLSAIAAQTIGPEDFERTVAGFDRLLECELDLLTKILSGQGSECSNDLVGLLDELNIKFDSTADGRPYVLLDPDETPESATGVLRGRFFET